MNLFCSNAITHLSLSSARFARGTHFSFLHFYSTSFNLRLNILIWFFPLSGHKWRSHRKLIAPTFHLNVLKGFIDLFNENSRQVIKKLNLEMGKTFDAHDYMSEATVEILLGKKIYALFIYYNLLYDIVYFNHLTSRNFNFVYFLPFTWIGFVSSGDA